MKKKKEKKYSLPVSYNEITFVYVLAGAVFVVGVMLVLWFVSQSFGRSTRSGIIIDPDPELGFVEVCEYRRLLDGVCVEEEGAVAPRVVAVMVENHSDARPQSGLADASVVYEAPVEANYSRFLLLYHENEVVNEIGPVRSARPYFVDWIQEYDDPLYMHVGGSPDALDQIKEDGVLGLNEFYRGWHYWRSTDRYAPHNVYTSSEQWTKALETYDSREEDTFSSWVFGTDVDQCNISCVDEIVITFLAPRYVVTWKYNTSTMQYARWQDGRPHKDRNGKPIVADTFIVQEVQTEVLDAVGRLGMQTTGGGEATVFRGGNAIEGTWQKNSKKERTMWFDQEGSDISLRPGKIWIEVANKRTKVVY
jgi:hypothetical protein